MIKDYDAAIDAFRKALETRPDDHQLWNKLGATQANSMECAKALPCDVNALELTDSTTVNSAQPRQLNLGNQKST